ncbi:pentatricopeptide repeat-containing protein At4g21065-like [Nymphaea colorata]|nr:pentatricopeptide repeat-containing protein At4g21065-like [Nymphaea colorata]
MLLANQVIPQRQGPHCSLLNSSAIQPKRLDQLCGQLIKKGCANLFDWNNTIKAYTITHKPHEGLLVYTKHILSNGLTLRPNAFTFLFLLRGCNLDEVRAIHAHVFKFGLQGHQLLESSLINFYANAGLADDAWSVFDGVAEKDLVHFTSMLNGFARNGRLDESLVLFREMLSLDFCPDSVAIVALLRLVAQFGAHHLGRALHSWAIKAQMMENLFVTTSILDTYAKCGDLEDACQVFGEMRVKDLSAWNALIAALAVHGRGEEAIQLFQRMVKEGEKPDQATLVSLLSACSHGGIVQKGETYFRGLLKGDFGFMPNVKHYGCMIDLLGRAGRLEDACELVETMLVDADEIVYATLLSAACTHGNVHIAEFAASRLLKMGANNAAYQVSLSNMYAAKGRWEKVSEIRSRMRDGRLKKMVGWSSIRINHQVHKFAMGEGLHPRSKEIHAMVEEMMATLKMSGYVPNTSVVLLDLDDKGKEQDLSRHSEKIAVAFGLISTSKSHAIKIMKNLRICIDCHTAMKFISLVYGRRIVIRDNKRFHHFEEGRCSCKDYW